MYNLETDCSRTQENGSLANTTTSTQPGKETGQGEGAKERKEREKTTEKRSGTQNGNIKSSAGLVRKGGREFSQEGQREGGNLLSGYIYSQQLRYVRLAGHLVHANSEKSHMEIIQMLILSYWLLLSSSVQVVKYVGINKGIFLIQI